MKDKLGTLIFLLGYPLIWVSLRKSRRAKVLVIVGDEILLVKNFIDATSRWSLPGGGIKGYETAKDAAVRELKEEIGCTFDSRKLREIGESERKSQGYKYTAVMFAITQERKRRIKTGFEITEAKWFPIKDLPKSRKPLVDIAIQKLKQG